MRSIGASLKAHIAQETTSIATCYRLTLTKDQLQITGITNASDGEVTTKWDHGLTTGQEVQIVGVAGMTEVNSLFYTATVTGAKTFTIGVNTSAYGIYTSGGEVRRTYGATNIDIDLYFEGVTYKADNGSVPSTIRINSGMVVDDVEMQSPFGTTFNVSEADIHAGRLDFAEAEAFIVNHQDLTMGKMIMIWGNTGEIKLNRDAYVNSVSSLSSQLNQDTIRLIEPGCSHDLGDSQCQVDTAALEVSGTVTSVTDRKDFDDTSRSEADDYFNYGLLTWSGGNNVGTSVEVKEFAGSNITLFESTIYDIEIGDTYVMIPGCDKIKQTCIDKYDNVVNFNGFDFLPGPAVLSDVGLKR